MSRRPGLAFATLVDIADVDAVRRHRAEYVLLHWNLPREFFNMIERKHQGPESMRFVARIRDRLTTTFGKPIVDDGILTVFRVGR
jgi:HD-like signal output (HDOD) protein